MKEEYLLTLLQRCWKRKKKRARGQFSLEQKCFIFAQTPTVSFRVSLQNRNEQNVPNIMNCICKNSCLCAQGTWKCSYCDVIVVSENVTTPTSFFIPTAVPGIRIQSSSTATVLCDTAVTLCSSIIYDPILYYNSECKIEVFCLEVQKIVSETDIALWTGMTRSCFFFSHGSESESLVLSTCRDQVRYFIWQRIKKKRTWIRFSKINREIYISLCMCYVVLYKYILYGTVPVLSTK